MVTQVSNISVSQDDKLTPFSELAAKPQVKSDILVRLATFLQTTLDYQKLLMIFKQEIAPAVLIEGFSFVHPENGIEFEDGQRGIHSCHYRLNAKDDFLGEITFYRSTRFREYELANLEALMGTLIYPLRNAMRYRTALNQAFKDPLTGAGNRIALDDSLKRELEVAKRHGCELSVLMLDLDHFKAINDQFGHLIGDEMLKVAVDKIGQTIRKTDMCFRYGGEEFVVILYNAHIADARLIAERIRMNIADTILETEKGYLQATVSCGLAVMQADDQELDLLNRADKALYQAKNTGRNKVCVFSPEPSPALTD
ncbi:GGDEF domain-containing protein [Bermanella sp. R86510]|uniref:GGDEF domain-containing protein n=1 Tax=unclassified Bermanella TaxID=2627862 RepID=UPI0037C8D2D7